MKQNLETLNVIGLKTLVYREVGRFLKVYMQTIIAPVVTTVLFYIIFSLAFGGSGRMANEYISVPYMQFLVPGLIMMSMAQNAFANSSSSLMIGKMQGNMIDILMAPLSPAEILSGYVIGGVLRGMLIGSVSVCILVPFVGLQVDQVLLLVAFGVLGTSMLALLGVLGGMWADKFDHIAAVTNFVVMPMTFLSGTFYSVQQLAPFWQDVAHLNPFFYMIDGFRAGFIGTADMPVIIGIGFLLAMNVILWTLAWLMLRTGYKIKT